VKIIVYVSRVRGDSSKVSDIDLLILVGQKVNTKVEEDIYGYIGILIERVLPYEKRADRSGKVLFKKSQGHPF